ncbi:MAG: hydrogenase formation protein HypD [Candidatus Bathyarchaeia archaeon]|nr:hydrogenase formation protein HypD [Candidatus Bathyarchaeota archaeon]
MYRFRDESTASKILERLKSMGLNLTLMHVCGTHQDTIVRYGLDLLLKGCGIEVRQGPGCPVCVTTMAEVEEAVALARSGKTVTTFGDMLRVPGVSGSLADARAKGADVRVVYSITDAVRIAEKTDREVVFVAIGFETTAPSTAVTILKGMPENFSILCFHRYLPPALDMLLSMGELKIQGIIEPGHVSTIIGVRPYEAISRKYKVPQVIAGFEPLDILMAVYMIARQLKNSNSIVENEYNRTVRYSGNLKALKLIDQVFEPVDSMWRGFPRIRCSKMRLREPFRIFDSEVRYAEELKEIIDADFSEPEGCSCNKVLRGLMEPRECPLFGRVCNPQSPIGACMVSMEGACNIEYRYRRIYKIS